MMMRVLGEAEWMRRVQRMPSSSLLSTISTNARSRLTLEHRYKAVEMSPAS